SPARGCSGATPIVRRLLGKIYRAIERAGKAADAASGGRGWQSNEQMGLIDGPGCSLKPACPAANDKCGLHAGDECVRVRIQAGVAGDVGAEVQKEVLPSLGEPQYINRLGTDEFHSSAATTRRSTRVPIRLKFFHRLDRIIAQRTLAGGDNIIDS